MSPAPEERNALIALTMVPGLGPARIRSLVAACGSACAVFAADRDRLTRVPGIGDRIAGDILNLQWRDRVRRQLELARRVNARCITRGDGEYPELLEQTFDPPPVLWGRGRHDVDLKQAIAIVGTRRPSHRGRRLAFDMAYGLARRGWTVVSGLAYGIDAAAHRGALEAGAATIAVLGCGADVVYPSAHRRLFRRILTDGTILTEFPMGSTPEASHFPRRNRVISGMCRGVLVVEAFEKGGGLITAQFALEQNREVFAVPGSPDSAVSLGCNRLIQAGAAKLTLSVDDIEVEFGIEPSHGTPSEPVPSHGNEPSPDPVLNALSDEPVHIDALCRITGLGPGELQSRLLILELKGRVAQLPGKRFYLTDGARSTE